MTNLVDDFFRWRQRKLLKDRPRDLEPTEEGVQASEPIRVEEHHASTTIVRRIRVALLNRLGRPL